MLHCVLQCIVVNAAAVMIVKTLTSVACVTVDLSRRRKWFCEGLAVIDISAKPLGRRQSRVQQLAHTRLARNQARRFPVVRERARPTQRHRSGRWSVYSRYEAPPTERDYDARVL